MSVLDGVDLPPNLQELVDQIKQILGDQQPTDDAPATRTDDAAAPAEPAATDDAAAAPAEPAATDDATGASPEIEVGNATTLPAPVPEPEETTPLQDYATYEATKDISDPNTAAVAGAAAAQVAGALQ